MTKYTTDHQEIKQWAEKHSGKPEIINSPNADESMVGLRIDFPGVEDEVFLSDEKPPEVISWQKFFEAFEKQQLAFEYEEGEEVRNPIDAYKFIKRFAIEESADPSDSVFSKIL